MHNDFQSETQAQTIIIANGGAAVSEIVCRFYRPPVISSTTASAAIKIPQTPIFDLDGFKSP